MDLLEHVLMLIAHWNVFPGSDCFFNRCDVKKTAKFTNADESFELYGNRKSDEELTRYARAILTQLLPTVERNFYKSDEELTRYVRALLAQLLPTVERNLYERVDGAKPDPNSEPKPEKSSTFPGIVKMHRVANSGKWQTFDQKQIHSVGYQQYDIRLGHVICWFAGS